MRAKLMTFTFKVQKAASLGELKKQLHNVNHWEELICRRGVICAQEILIHMHADLDIRASKIYLLRIIWTFLHIFGPLPPV